MATDPTYFTFHIDKNAPDLPKLAQKYRTLRLEALQNAKDSFASTFEEESTWPLEKWTQRLSRPGVEHLVVAARQQQQPPSSSSEWLGQVALLGPQSLADFALPPASGEPVAQTQDAARETRWQLTALYTSREHRGRGLGKMLCRAAVAYAAAAAAADEQRRARLRLFVGPLNTDLVAFYAGLGFRDAGMCTLEEAMVADGDGALLPPVGERDAEKFQSRIGVVMALVT